MVQLTAGSIFISYSRRDETTMRRVVTFLRGQDLTVWVDNEKLVPGTPIWEIEIEKAIREAGAVVVLLSPDSNTSVWVRREISFAERYSKRIFPLLITGDEFTSVMLRLATNQYVDIRGGKEEAGLHSLTAALKFYLEDITRKEEEEQKIAKEKAEREAAEKATKEKAAKEKARRAAARKAAREKTKRDAAEKAAKEKAEREAAEKAAKEKAEREAAEKATKEKARRAAARKAAREKAESEATEKAAKEKAEREAAERKVYDPRILFSKAKSFVEMQLIDKIKSEPHFWQQLDFSWQGSAKAIRLFSITFFFYEAILDTFGVVEFGVFDSSNVPWGWISLGIILGVITGFYFGFVETAGASTAKQAAENHESDDPIWLQLASHIGGGIGFLSWSFITFLGFMTLIMRTTESPTAIGGWVILSIPLALAIGAERWGAWKHETREFLIFEFLNK